MEIGMLWYDGGPAKLKERVQRAAEYYAGKYGRKPNLCLVNPAMLKGDAGKFNGVQVRPAASVMPDHFWIGMEEQAGKNGGSDGSRRAGAKGSPKSAARKSRGTRGNAKKAD